MCGSIFIETPRLLVKNPSMTDFSALRMLQQDPEVMRYMGGPRDEARVIANVDKLQSHLTKHGFSFGPVYDKETRQFIGRAGLVKLDFDDKSPDVEFGFFILKPYWNKGFATELGDAFMKYAFESLGVPRVYVTFDPENGAVRQVCEKLGMHFDRASPYVALEKTQHFYVKEKV